MIVNVSVIEVLPYAGSLPPLRCGRISAVDSPDGEPPTRKDGLGLAGVPAAVPVRGGSTWTL